MIRREEIQKDFDRIALLSERESEPAGIPDPFLRQFVPARCDRALEIGCGTGTFTRLLARQADHVVAIDLSREMIRVARQHSIDYHNIEYSVADVMEMDLPSGEFDCIVMIATLHHVPIDQILTRLKQALRPEGVLIIHDLLTPSGIFDRATDLIRIPVSMATTYVRTGQFWPSREVRRAWAEHGKHERYLTRVDVMAMRDQYLQGAYVKHHLLWRYTLVWRKQAEV